jgi:hypothetical protein
MKTTINDEVLKFKLFTNYKNNLTLTENIQTISESIGGGKLFLELISSNPRTIKKSLENIKLTKFTTKSGVKLSNVDEIIDAISKGKDVVLSAKEIGSIKKSLYNGQQTDANLREAIAVDVAKWLKKKGGNYTDNELSSILTEKGFTNPQPIINKYKLLVGKPWKKLINSFRADPEVMKLYAFKPAAQAKVEEWVKANIKEGRDIETKQVIKFITDFGEKGTKVSRFVKKYITPYLSTITLNKVLLVIGIGIAIGAFTIKDTLLFACSRLGYDWSNKMCGDSNNNKKTYQGLDDNGNPIFK